MNELSIYQSLIKNEEFTDLYGMTKLTIFFEGLYQSLADDDEMKKQLLQLRLERWKNHFGTPTLAFLMSYQDQINNIASINLQNFDFNFACEIDHENHVIVKKDAVKNVVMPAVKEAQGKLIKTHNPIGGFTTIPSDPYSKEFLAYAAQAAKHHGRVLEIGTAFGAASLEALSLGATVFCNDIDVKNLAVISNRYFDDSKDRDTTTGDGTKLIFVPGSFPEELSGLPTKSFDAILICRVLHFFKGEAIEKSVKQMGELLKPGGKLFIICETPYLKNWQRCIPEFEKRVADGVEWPGEFTNHDQYETSGRAATLPKLMHWMTKEVMDRTINRTGILKIEKSSYINRAGQFPDDLILDGRESIGVIAVRE